jgi:hypothetical protein
MLPEFGEIWLSPLRDDCQFTYLRRKKEKKEKKEKKLHTTTRRLMWKDYYLFSACD